MIVVPDREVRLALASMAVERIVDGTQEESNAIVWSLVERAKRQWAAADRLAPELGLSPHDVMTILRAVDEAIRDGHPPSWLARWVDDRRLNSHGRECTEQVVIRCLEEFDAEPPPELPPPP